MIDLALTTSSSFDRIQMYNNIHETERLTTYLNLIHTVKKGGGENKRYM